MNRNKKSNTVPVLVLIILILLGREGWLFYQSHKELFSSVETVKPASTPVASNPAILKPPADTVISGWKAYSNAAGFFLKFPPYTAVGLDTKSGKSNLGPTTLEYHELAFTPNPNADFVIFKSSVAVDGAKNFILDLGLRFVSYDVSTETWYVNSDDKDKPSAGSHTYKNIFKPGNEFKPNVFVKTTQGTDVYGPFTLGDESRGTHIYLVPIPEKNIIVALSVTFNNEALDASTASVKSLKTKFDKDLPQILKSLVVSE